LSCLRFDLSVLYVDKSLGFSRVRTECNFSLVWSNSSTCNIFWSYSIFSFGLITVLIFGPKTVLRFWSYYGDPSKFSMKSRSVAERSVANFRHGPFFENIFFEKFEKFINLDRFCQQLNIKYQILNSLMN
jgi:hypothetical protein